MKKIEKQSQSNELFLSFIYFHEYSSIIINESIINKINFDLKKNKQNKEIDTKH